MTKICSECQTVNDDESEFCKKCGVTLTDIKPEPSTQKRRITKTAVISGIVFILLFSWSLYDFLTLPKYSYLGPGTAMFTSTCIGLICAVPTYIVGWLIRRFTSKNN